MALTRKYLQQCEKLGQAGLLVEFESGQRVARGFADLGYEEFYLLSPGRVVSILTGHTAAINAGDERHFFSVPECDELVNELLKAGCSLELLQFVDQREWRLVLQRHGGAREFRAPELRELLVQALIWVLADASQG